MRHMFSVNDPISYVASVIICMLTHHTDTLTDSKNMFRCQNHVMTREKAQMTLTGTKVKSDSLQTQSRPRCTRVARFIFLTPFPCRFNTQLMIELSKCLFVIIKKSYSFTLVLVFKIRASKKKDNLYNYYLINIMRLLLINNVK